MVFHGMSSIFDTQMQQKDSQNQKTSRSEKLRYRLILQEEGSFAEQWAMRVQPSQLKWLLGFSVMTIALLTYGLVALTPLRETIVPGYLTTESREMQAAALRTADSLTGVLEVQGRYIENFRAILSGDLPPQAITLGPDIAPTTSPSTSFNPQGSGPLDELRSRVEEEDAFAIGKPGSLDNSGLFLPPVEGQISSEWNPNVGHWGIDLVAPENSPVRAVASGTVLFAGFTSGGGHTVMVQHPDDRVSVYMHNSRVEVQSGDRVAQGALLAFIGNSGGHSTGPHLHFEWWESGRSIDPQMRMSID